MSTLLSVNLNAIAHLRNRRDLPWPNVIKLGRIALQAGAGGLTVHPRPDERHIRFQDVVEIKAFLQNEFPKAEFNIEGFPSDNFLELAEKYADQVTLVPDDPNQSTSDHGWDFIKDEELLAPIVCRLVDAGKRVSLFANPSPIGLEIAKKIGAHRIEFYTGPYGATFDNFEQEKIELEKLKLAANFAHSVGLDVNAGHDLTVSNLSSLVKAIPFLAEVSIGHGLIADSLEYGMKQTVQRYINALKIKDKGS